MHPLLTKAVVICSVDLLATLVVLRFLRGVRIAGRLAFVRAFALLGGLNVGLSLVLWLLRAVGLLGFLSLFSFGLVFLLAPALGSVAVLRLAMRRARGLEIDGFFPLVRAAGILALGQLLVFLVVR